MYRVMSLGFLFMVFLLALTMAMIADFYSMAFFFGVLSGIGWVAIWDYINRNFRRR